MEEKILLYDLVLLPWGENIHDALLQSKYMAIPTNHLFGLFNGSVGGDKPPCVN